MGFELGVQSKRTWTKNRMKSSFYFYKSTFNHFLHFYCLLRLFEILWDKYLGETSHKNRIQMLSVIINANYFFENSKAVHSLLTDLLNTNHNGRVYLSFYTVFSYPNARVSSRPTCRQMLLADVIWKRVMHWATAIMSEGYLNEKCSGRRFLRVWPYCVG